MTNGATRTRGDRPRAGGVRRTSLFALALALAGACACSERPPDGARYVWLELGPGGERIARAVTTAAVCPAIEIDGRKRLMAIRAAPDPPDFPVLTCEATVPPAARRASVGGVALPLPPSKVKRIAIIGDTGCRILAGHVAQDCDDPESWPFARLAGTVADLVAWLRGEPDDRDLDDLARSIARLDPDVIVHVGDYVYREGPCPDDHSACTSGPHGYDWATMEADFFIPAGAILREAPLLLARGNHELCDRAGAAWFRFLDPRPFDPTCAEYTEPYAVDVGGLQFLMLDSAAAQDRAVDPAQAAIYRQQFAELVRLAGPRSFLVTHRPLWVFGHAGEEDGQEVLFRGNPTLEVASKNELPRGLQLVLSGHVHVFQVLDFEGMRPSQLVIGNSGTGLDPAVRMPLGGLEIAGGKVALGETESVFGFATLEAQGSDWRLMLRNLGGTPLHECTISGLEIWCS